LGTFDEGESGRKAGFRRKSQDFIGIPLFFWIGPGNVKSQKSKKAE